MLRFLTHDGYLKLRDELPEDLRPLYVVGFHTGARLGELLSLKWPASGLRGPVH